MAKALFLPQQKSEKVHEATLHVLENTGVKLDHEEALDLFLSAGAKKDRDGRILLPKDLVNHIIEHTRQLHHLRLYDRDGKNPIRIRLGRTYFGPGGDALYNVDRLTRHRRKSVLSDVKTNVWLADALPNFEFIMSMALPEDVDQKKLYPTVFAEMARYTQKPIISTMTSLEDLKHIHRVASIIAGSEKKLHDKPFFIAYLDPISPLRMERSGTDRLLFCAEKGIPILYAAGANCGSSAPITAVGGVVQGGAESLAGLVLAHLKNENAQFVYGANTSAMDMRSTIVAYGDPTWFRTTAMYADLGRYYGLPSWGTAGSTDSFRVDAQAALEAYEGISLVIMSGTTLAHDVGFMAHGELYDPRMLVLTDMMIGRARHIFRVPELTDDNLALEVIDEVSRGNGVYLGHPHTARKFREALWLPPRYLNREHITVTRNYTLPELLWEEVERCLETHKPSELDPGKVTKIKEYLDSI